jgi:hypothetical protein
VANGALCITADKSTSTLDQESVRGILLEMATLIAAIDLSSLAGDSDRTPSALVESPARGVTN